ncbi:MAG: response regulator [Deltaproteobacteria bacterium]|nr:response regulator [Deltaproteobacteria bacterium]
MAPELAEALMPLFAMACEDDPPLSECWATFTEVGRRLLGTTVGMVTERRDDELVFVHLLGGTGTAAPGDRIALDQAFCGLPLQLGHVLFCPDVSVSEYANHPAVAAMGLTAYAGVPLVVDERTVGTLCLFCQGGFPATIWTEAHREVLVMMGLWLSRRQQRERNRQLLRDKERHDLMLRTLFDGMQQMAGFIAPDGTMLASNAATLEALGVSAQDVVGFKAWECAWVRDQDHAQRLEDSVHRAAKGEVIRYTENIAVPDGPPISIDFSLTPIHEECGAVAFLLAEGRDLTPIIEEQRRRQAIERKVQETQKLESLGVLAGGIVHDFNNLLTGILGNASLVRASLPEKSSLAPQLREIESAARSSADLCQQLLAYSGRGRFVVSTIDLSALVADCTELLKLSISKSTVLRLELEGGPMWVSGDATQLKQVLMNLVINASEALGGEPGRVTVRAGFREVEGQQQPPLDVDATEPGSHVVLTVSDEGCGMTEDIRRQVFEPFYSTKFTGRGLGLAVVQGIVRAHRGGLRLTSEPGAGTTFELLFPLVGTPAEATESRTGPRPKVPQYCGTALVIDDTPGIGRVMRLMLRKLGMKTIEARDGMEGVQLFEEHRDELTVVFLDLTMPRLDGHATHQLLRHRGCTLPVVLMSGYNEQEISERFEDDDIAAFLQKPISFGAMQRALTCANGQPD